MSRKHKKHEEHENHERWLVSYADFITLLFAFFVVMYAISSVNEGKYRVLSDSLVSAFQKAPRSTLPIPVGKEAPSPNPGSANLIKHTLPTRKGDAAQDSQPYFRCVDLSCCDGVCCIRGCCILAYCRCAACNGYFGEAK